MVSSWARDVRGRADGFAARARRNATTGSVWLRGQAARAVAFVQTGVDALGDRVASRQDSVVARGADWARKKGSTSVT
ncbi:hypothetical protein AUC68_09270 [Methyloceanibacter methanicus]|uniref:Uncharacterized protein n=1 Tax=Methyloceanibacter methanicus TaxID=1774968 RepID=A0A1E3VYF8_9HYPH|nr:hypothetical protein AUC68_09270 [Methyloceanibacter methanicus]